MFLVIHKNMGLCLYMIWSSDHWNVCTTTLTLVCIFLDSSDGITSASGVSLRKVNYASNSASAILMMVFQFVKDNSAIHRKITECLADHKDDLTKGISKEQKDRPTEKNKTKKFILLLILKSVSSMILLFYYLPPQQNETMLSWRHFACSCIFSAPFFFSHR